MIKASGVFAEDWVMRKEQHKDVWIAAGTMGTMSWLLLSPRAYLFGIFAALGLRPRSVDEKVGFGLEQLLEEDCMRLRESIGEDPLDFRTSRYVRGLQAGIGWQRVKLVRTICERIKDGYRVRIRAFGEGAKKRVIVRATVVDLRVPSH